MEKPKFKWFDGTSVIFAIFFAISAYFYPNSNYFVKISIVLFIFLLSIMFMFLKNFFVYKKEVEKFLVSYDNISANRTSLVNLYEQKRKQVEIAEMYFRDSSIYYHSFSSILRQTNNIELANHHEALHKIHLNALQQIQEVEQNEQQNI